MKSKHFFQGNPPPRLNPLAADIRRTLAAGSLGAALASAPLAVMAGPTGGEVVAGQASVSQQGSQTTVNQGSARAVVNWNSFNVGPKESVNFNQPNASAAILNRVVGVDSSTILGRITANGQVYLVNPNGILFGRGSQVNVGSLVASTANIGNADFMAGRMAFTKSGNPKATVVNEGSITVSDGGFVGLVAPGVRNSGVINAKLGKVTLAAGDAFVLDLHGDGLINLVVDPAAMKTLTDANGTPFSAFVDHSGTITAEGGHVSIAAATVKRLMDNVINVSGTVRATSFDAKPGAISLLGDASTQVALSGRLDASGTEGGKVSVTGRDVTLASTSAIDAIGSAGHGGTVSVGGNWQGKGPLMNARQVNVEHGAVINATGQTSGGTVAVWSDGTTRFNGMVQNSTGNVEVSGKGVLAFGGDVQAASLLLDPTNLTVSDNGSDFANGLPVAEDSTIAAFTLNRQLAKGTPITLQASKQLTVASQIDGRGGVGGGALHLEAGNIALNANIVLNNGNFTATTPGQLTQADNAGVYTGSASLDINGAGGVQMQRIVSGGNVRLTSTGGRVIVNTPIVSLDNSGAVGNVALLAVNGAAGVTLNGALAGPGGINVTSSAGDITTGAARLESTGLVSLNAGGRLNVGTGGIKVTTAANVDLTGAQDVTATGPVATDGGTITIMSERDVTMNQLASRLSANAPSGAVDIKSKDGNVVLAGELGGPNTGYTNFDAGYQRSLRPDVGKLTVNAGKSVETNGLNLDGNDAFNAKDLIGNDVNGLEIKAGMRIIVNKQVAVNKGDILLQSTGSADTDGIYLGNNVYSRGHDFLSTGSRSTNPAERYINTGKTAYAVAVRAAKNLVLFDNADERVDYNTLSLAQTGGAAGKPPVYAYSLAKIIVSNNAANYSGNEANSLVQTNNMKAHPKLVLEGFLSGAQQLPQMPLRIDSKNIVLTELSTTPNNTQRPGRSSVDGQGIALKLLAYRSLNDKQTELESQRCNPSPCLVTARGNTYAFYNEWIGFKSLGTVESVDVSKLFYRGLNSSIQSVTKIDEDSLALYPSYNPDPATAQSSIDTQVPNSISRSFVETETYIRTSNLDGSRIFISPDGLSLSERSDPLELQGSRFIFYDGVIQRDRGGGAADTRIPVGNTTGDFTAANNTSSNFAQIGGFGNVSGPTPPPPPPPPGEITILPPPPPPPPVESLTVTTVEREAQTNQSIPVDDIAVGMRPAADADLGRGSSLGGSARNVFATRYRIARTTDATLCVPEDIEPTLGFTASGTVGNDEKRCR